MPLPEDGLWTVTLAVTRRRAEEGYDEYPPSASSSPPASARSTESSCAHDPTDWVTIKMGPAHTSLQSVASVKNVLNEDLGEVGGG